jgi:hypothetical protein
VLIAFKLTAGVFSHKSACARVGNPTENAVSKAMFRIFEIIDMVM